MSMQADSAASWKDSTVNENIFIVTIVFILNLRSEGSDTSIHIYFLIIKPH